MRVFAFFVILAVYPAAMAQDIAPTPPNLAETAAQHAEPGLNYGYIADLPLPKTVLFSASPDEIIADAEEWARHGVTAFFMDYVARDWSSDIWATDGKPWTIGESDEMFQKAKQANAVCRRIGSETFLKVAFDHFFEWFNDLAWEQAYHNFRQFAVFARETGCNGIALDIEYVGDQYDFNWEGYTYDGYSRADLVAKIRERMTKVMQILYDVFPDMVFLAFPEQGLGLGQHIHAAWIEEAARRNAPGGIHYCTEHTYRNPNIRDMFAYAWACNNLFHRVLSDSAYRYWTEQCSIAVGVWPFGFNYQDVYEPGMALEDLRQGYAASLMVSSRYNWIYSHNCREQLIGRGRDKFKGEHDLNDYLSVFIKREVVTTPKYVALTKELRQMALRDYSADLGLTPFVSLEGPFDDPVVRLMPAGLSTPGELEKTWPVALAYYRGEDIDVHRDFATVTEWMVIGPFANEGDLGGHNIVYPPEQGIDLAAAYSGLNGDVRWMKCSMEGKRVSVDFTKIFQPTEQVCAYALCYVTTPAERSAQIRIGTNDSGKAWLGGRLIYDYPQEGTALLDRDIIPVTLPAGTTPILIKVCNNRLNWGFVFRITDTEGRPLDNIQYGFLPKN